MTRDPHTPATTTTTTTSISAVSLPRLDEMDVIMHGKLRFNERTGTTFEGLSNDMTVYVVLNSSAAARMSILQMQHLGRYEEILDADRWIAIAADCPPWLTLHPGELTTLPVPPERLPASR